MDSSANNISFDSSGICNYCIEFKLSHESLHISNNSIDKLIDKIKSNGKNKDFDCVVGISGGIDSSWVLVKAIEQGLRPLAVHMDNGWNSELAQNNISNLVTKLGIELYTYVINWDEYRNFMQAFFNSDVIDVELLYDNAMLAVNYKLAKKFNLKYILSGDNSATEGMRMPEKWNHLKFDKKNIEFIGKKFNNVKINTFPSIGTLEYFFNRVVRGIKWVHFLDYFDFNKNESLQVLINKYNYKPYPYKHYESIFTRFYQGYILPNKFNVDKRKLHLSTLIVTKQITRDESLNLLSQIPYNSEEELIKDKKYFLKKMNWDENNLRDYISRPGIVHSSYPNEVYIWNFVKKINNFFNKNK